jgi:hypothetical protein
MVNLQLQLLKSDFSHCPLKQNFHGQKCFQKKFLNVQLKNFFRPITFYKMFFLWKIFHNRLSLLFSGFGNNIDSNAAAARFNAAPGASAFNTEGSGEATNSFGNIGSAASASYGGGYGGTQANAVGDSGFFGNSGDGVFVNQSGGIGNQVVSAGRIGSVQYINCNFRGGGNQ